MADLNPLAFAVAIRDEATKDLNAIEAKLKSLKDQTITVKVEGLAELKSLLETLKSGGNNAPSTNVGEKLAQDVDKATAALKKEEEELARLKQIAESTNIGSTMAEDLRRAEVELNNIEAHLKRIAAFKLEQEKIINSTHEKYGGPIKGSEIYDMPMVKKALEEDRKEQEKNVAALDKKWDEYWRKQEQEAQRFAVICKKSFEQISFSDFYKHVLSGGDIANAAKSWLRVYTKDMYGEYFGKDGDLYKEMTQMRGMQRAGSLSKEMEEELKVLEAYQRKYNEFWKQRNQASSATPRYDSAFGKVLADQEAYLQAQGRIAGAAKVEKEVLEKQAAAQQKLNEIKAQATAQDQKKTQAAAAVAAQEEKVAQASEKVAQATQAQAQATQQAAQAQSQLSQKEIGTIAKNAVIEELKRSLGYISEAKEAIKNDSFTKFTERVNNATEAINKLTEAFGKFKATIGENKDLKDILSGWGAAIKEINAAMTAINAAKNEGGGKKRGVSGQTNEEIKQEEQGLVKVAAALGQVRSAMASGGGTANIPFLEGITRTGERNIQTLIKEQAHIERLIAIAQKSITFGEGHPVMGMNTLKVGQMNNLQDLEALRNKIREILLLANQGDQAMIRFLNISGSLKTTVWGKDAMGNDVTLLGGHFDKLTHSVTGTAQAMRTLNNEMRLDSNVWGNSERETAQRRYNQLLADSEKLLRRIDEAGSKGFKLGLDTSLTRVGSRDVMQFIEKALQFKDIGNFRALNELIGQFSRLKAVYGEVAREQEKMNNARISAGEKADAQYMKEVEQYTKKCIQEYNAWQESIRRAGVEMTNLKIKIRELESVERRGQAAGVDTSVLKSRIQAMRQELSILQDIHNGSKAYGQTKDYIKTEGYQERIKLAQEEAKAVKNSAIEREKADSKAIRDLENIETNQRRYNQLLTEAQALQDRLANASAKGGGLLLDISKTESALNQLQQHIDQVLNFNMRNLKDNHVVNELIANWNALKKTLTSVAVEQEKVNTSQEKANKTASGNATKAIQQENDKWAESMRRASIEATKLKIQIDKLKEVESKGKAGGIDTSSLTAQIAQLQSFYQKLLAMSGGAKIHGTAGELVNTAAYQNAIRLANEEAAAIKNAAGATQHFTSEQQRLSQALSQSTEHMKGQSQVLSDLKSLATQYLGVWGAQGFLRNIIEIGGQLEMQRLSIGAILQNAYQANDLFDQIKSLAVQSPFGVVELDQMTKQLSAYGFKYSELFDMTKRLADISAATGTSVDRLALALGHVRSEAALSGYTLRQFSMANVPLLEKLSERLGKTKKEIREMTKKKEVGYEDVLAVIMDLTNEGGMFYNAQEVMSQSVKAKFKNVKDAMDIMYGEMAESSVIGEPLKRVAELLMQLTKNWKDAATVLGTGAALWLINKARVGAYTMALGAENVATVKSIASHKAKELSQLRLAQSYRKLSAAEQSQVATSKLLTLNERLRLALNIPLTNAQKLRIMYARKQMMSDLQVALSSGKVTTEYIARQVAIGKLTKAEGLLIIGNAKLEVAEEQAGMMAVINTQRMGVYRMALIKVWNAMKGFGASLLAMGPSMLIMGGITAVMELWSRNKQEMEKAGELGDKILDRWTEGAKKVKEVMESTKMTFTVDGASNIENYGIKPGKIDFPDASTLSSDAIQASIETWEEFIKSYSATPNLMLNAAFATDENGRAVHSLAEQYKILGENATLVMNSLPLLKNVSTALSDAIKDANSGVFDNNLLTDLKDYENAYKDVAKKVAAVAKNYKLELSAALTAARENDKFRAALDKAGISAENLSGQTAYLIDRMKEYPEAVKLFNDAIQLPNGVDLGGIAFDQKQDLESAFSELQSEFSEVAQKFKEDLSGQGWDFDNLKPEQVQAITMAFSDAFTEAGLSVDEVKGKVMDLCKDEYNVIIDVKTAAAAAKISAIKQELNDLVSDEKRPFSIDIGTTTNFFEVADKINKAYWAAKETIEKAPGIFLKMGIKLDVSDVGTLTDAQITQIAGDNAMKRAVLEEVRDAQRQIHDALIAKNAYGLKFEAPRGYGGKDKDKNKNKDKNKGGTKTYKDEVAEEWRERIRLLKDANTLYKEWEKRKNKDEGLKRVSEQYGDIFSKWRTDKNLPWKDFKVEDIIDLRDYIQKITDAAQKRYDAQRNDKAKNYGKEAEQVLREGLKALDDIDRHIFDESVKDFSSLIERTISELNERWDIYKTVREATSNPLLAQEVAGFGAIDLGARTSAEAIKRELVEQLRDAGGEGLLPQIQFDLHLDEEGIRKQLSEAIPDTDKADKYAEKVESLVKIYKEWQNLQKQVTRDDISAFSQLIGSVVSYDAKVQKLNDDLQKQKESTAALLAAGKIKEEDADRANEIADAQYDWEKMKLSAEYANIYNNAVAMSREEFESAAGSIELLLKKLRELGLISPDDYVSEKEKLDKARQEWSTTGVLGERGAVGQFISGGYEGLLNYYAERRDKARQNEKNAAPGSAEQKKWGQEADHYGKLFTKLSKMSDAANDVVTAFQTLQSSLDLVKNLFDSLGMEGAANVAGDASTILGGALGGASALSALGPWGMAAGAALGLVTGIAQTHDAALERQIGKLREDVEKIEANTALIQQARERTLGYDTGELRRQYAQQYSSSPSISQAENSPLKYLLLARNSNYAMANYYGQNTSGNGYQQEYNNLIKERQDYLDILDAQMSKKKKSNAEIEETKQKIAELDDQIRYFTQDLAKELWDIDIKGWADQLSDALASAFENGESMAKAYGDTVRSILQSVMRKMMQMKILEPMFESLQDKLFGDNGVFNAADINGSMSAVKKVIEDFFGTNGEGRNSITAATEFMTAFQHGLQASGLSVLNDTSSTLSSNVQGVKEETADLLAGYVNALRQDVAVNRLLLDEFVAALWPQYYEAFVAHTRVVTNIDNNVQVMMEMMRDGRGAMYEEIHGLRSRIDNVVNGIESFAMK